MTEFILTSNGGVVHRRQSEDVSLTATSMRQIVDNGTAAVMDSLVKSSTNLYGLVAHVPELPVSEIRHNLRSILANVQNALNVTLETQALVVDSKVSF